MTALNAVADYACRDDGIAIVTIDNPPVNALSSAVWRGIEAGYRRALADGAKALIYACAGKTFISGADLREFGLSPEKALELDMAGGFCAIEDLPFPVIAAIHGTTFGGGLEFALTCHYRVAAAGSLLALPEVSLGLLPGGGGSQRLPRLAGAETALDMLLHARRITAEQALAWSIVDQCTPPDRLMQAAIAFAQQHIAGQRPIRRVGHGAVDPAPCTAGLFQAARCDFEARMPGFLAVQRAIDLVEASMRLPVRAGMEREASFVAALMRSPQAAALQQHFFSERKAAKLPGRADAPAPLSCMAGPGLGVDHPLVAAIARTGVPVAAGQGTGQVRLHYQGADGPAQALLMMVDAPGAAAAIAAGDAIGLALPPADEGSQAVEVLRTDATPDEWLALAVRLLRQGGMKTVLTGLGGMSATARLVDACGGTVPGQAALKPPLAARLQDVCRALLAEKPGLEAHVLDFIAVEALNIPRYLGGPLFAARHGV
ncbi:MAG: hypothetical protein Tsb0016_12870 [Sphingomonadales bacterium]